AQVVEFAPFGRAEVGERVALRVEVRLAEERGYEGDEKKQDQPRRVDDETGGETHHRHDVLSLAEQLAHQRHAPAGLAARTFELVLELSVFEIFKIENHRM